VHHVVPAPDLDRTIDGLLAEIVTSAPEAIAAAKALIPAVAGRAAASVSSLTTETIARHRTSREGQDGLRAFLEKRKAPWVP
jgi:methylglutaconyl-CoA hydratase